MFKGNKVATKALKKMEKTKQNIYLTGDAGSGKSTLLREFIKNTNKNVVILAPTGLAAINIGGETIHSFCKFSTDPLFTSIKENKIKKIKDHKKIKELDCIVIDEISMVRADVLDGLDVFFKKNLGNQKPFGGLQIILIGDHFQLPPILRNDEKSEFLKQYECEYFFAAKVFPKMKVNFFKLTQIYRQSDKKFLKLLTYLRYGVKEPRLISWINNSLYENHKKSNTAITIATRNLDVTRINRTRLEKLPGEVTSYKAAVEGTFKKESFPTEKYLVLKKDAQVMFIKNDLDKNWVNGTIGKIVSLHKNHIKVKVHKKTLTVTQDSWEINKYEYNEKNNRLEKITIGSFHQFPLKLAWAVTIHKSQGQTFEECQIDMGAGAFVFGQTYVAFSRCVSLAGLSLVSPIRSSDIKSDPNIINFDKATKWIK